jgi:hypothetical protein
MSPPEEPVPNDLSSLPDAGLPGDIRESVDVLARNYSQAITAMMEAGLSEGAACYMVAVTFGKIGVILLPPSAITEREE